MTVTSINEIKAATFDQDELIKGAFLECLEELARFAILDRPPRDAVRILSSWTDTFSAPGREAPSRASEANMTHANWNDYSAADFDLETRAMGQESKMADSTITLTPLSVLRASAEVFGEQAKRLAGLERELRELREKLETIERGTKPAARLVTPSTPGAMIA